MSNLTDLLPSGAGGKQVSFTASGTISSGQTVGLNSDGTVSVISAAAGDDTTFYSGRTSYNATAYDSTNNKIVVFYRDQDDSSKGKAQVGTVSGTSITFGSAVEFEAGRTFYIDAVFDPDSGKVIVSYEDDTNSSYGTAIVGTISGTSISFGSAVVFSSTNVRWTSVTYDTNVDRVAISYASYTSYQAGFGIAGQVSGTSITFGTAVQFDTDNSGSTSIENTSIVFDSTNNKVVVIYKGASQKIQGVVGTISGTSISFGTPADVSAVTDYRRPKAVFDSNAGKVFVILNDSSDSYAKGVVGTVSGTSISFGTVATLSSITMKQSFPSAVYDPDNQNIKVIFTQSASPNSLYVFTATISGTSVSASGERVLHSTQVFANQNNMVYDTAANKVVVATKIDSNDYGVAFVLESGSGTSSANFIGIADAAISDSASGSVTLKGGIATNSSLLPLTYSGTLGSDAVFENAEAEHIAAGFDSNSNKIVVAYNDAGNSSRGTAVVGTVSGTSISWGTPVVYNDTGLTTYPSISFDSSSNKVVIFYTDASVSDKGRAIVGTVSGTSISFGAETTFADAQTTFNSATFDSNIDKHVVAYRDVDNSSYGTAIVGTVSGTSITFGTEVVFSSESTVPNITFDSSNNKVVIAYKKSNPDRGKGIVGTVSGTTISFGTEAEFSNGNNIGNNYTRAVFDSNRNKILVTYQDSDNSNYLTAAVGTVSGTSISFGDPVVIESAGTVVWPASVFDSSTNQFVITYTENAAGYYRIGEISSAGVFSAGDRTQWTDSYTNYSAGAFDSNENTVVIAWKDPGNSNYGTGIGIQITGSSALTTGSTYYVQDDGTLSTTSSSVTAGKALSATSINLEYNS